MRRLRTTAVASLTVVALMVGVSSVAAQTSPAAAVHAGAIPTLAGVPLWTATIGSNVEFSSPSYGTINGVPVVAAASLDGRVYLFNAITGSVMPGWVGGKEAVVYSGGAPTAVDSSPTFAYFDGPSNPPSIVVGLGSQSVKDQNGGVIAWNADGSVRFVFHTKHTFNQWRGETGAYDNSVFATPAVGHIQGNGQEDVVFGAFDHYIYALGPTGKLLPGFPIQRADTIWSSAALVDTGTGRDDIVMGGDATGFHPPGAPPCYGGWVTNYQYSPALHGPKLLWERCIGQSVWSSPAIGVINSTKRLAVVVGTSFNAAYHSNATDELFAFYLSNGAGVKGWPVKTVGPSFGSPVIAKVTKRGSPEVISSSCAGCTHGPAEVEAWTGGGRRIWATAVSSKYEMMASPAVANVTGSGPQDVLIGDTSGVYVLNGSTGRLAASGQFADGCRLFNTPAVFRVAGLSSHSGWELVLSCTKGGVAYLEAFVLNHAPDQTPSWPEWRQNSTHTGYAGKS